MAKTNLDYSKTQIGVADTDLILTSTTIADGTFAPTGQPDAPRNITIAVTTSTITAGFVNVYGVDNNGNAVVETLDLSSDTTLTGTLNFASVTSIVVTDLADEDPGDTFIVGTGDDVQVTTGNTLLGEVIISETGGTAGPYKIIDGTTGDTANVATITTGLTQPLIYNIILANGLRVVMAGTESVTLTYQQ